MSNFLSDLVNAGKALIGDNNKPAAAAARVVTPQSNPYSYQLNAQQPQIQGSQNPGYIPLQNSGFGPAGYSSGLQNAYSNPQQGQPLQYLRSGGTFGPYSVGAGGNYGGGIQQGFVPAAIANAQAMQLQQATPGALPQGNAYNPGYIPLQNSGFGPVGQTVGMQPTQQQLPTLNPQQGMNLY
jgi:hypothetical protein